MNKRLSAKKLALLGVLTACALIMFVVENLFPSFILPGAKMGLSNIFTMLTLILLGPAEAVVLIIARTVLGCLITGNISALMYSLTAGIVSITVSIVLYRLVFPKISVMAISIAGAVVHNLVQTVVFCLITQTPEYFAFMGYLVIFGVLSGGLVGTVTMLLLKYVPENFYTRFFD